MSLESGLRFLENPGVLQVSITRRGLIGMAATAAAALTVLGDAPSAEAKRREVEVFRASSLSPIYIPEIGINSSPLNIENLPQEVKRIVLFFTGLGCTPCEEMEHKMKSALAARPRDTIVIPVDKSLSAENLSLLGSDRACHDTFDLKHGPGYIKPRGEINDGSCDHIRRWLKGKYEFFTQHCGSPGVYQNEEDTTVSAGWGIPEFVVVRRADGKVIRRPQSKGAVLRLEGRQIWKAILGES